jgi:hypothetical protein
MLDHASTASDSAIPIPRFHVRVRRNRLSLLKTRRHQEGNHQDDKANVAEQSKIPTWLKKRQSRRAKKDLLFAGKPDRLPAVGLAIVIDGHLFAAGNVAEGDKLDGLALGMKFESGTGFEGISPNRVGQRSARSFSDK